MNAKPRLVTIWANYGPYHLARVHALETAGFDVIGYSYAATVPGYEFFRGEPAQHRLINNRSADALNPLLSWWRTFIRLWRDEPELVLACGYERPETLAAVIYSKLKRLVSGRRPTVVMMVDNQFDDKPRRHLLEAVKRRYLSVVDGFLVGGSTHIDYLTSLGVDPTRIHTGYNCVDNDRIQLIAKAIRDGGVQSTFPNHFLTLSRLVPKKNLGLVLLAYAAYRAQLPSDLEPWDLVVAGDGPVYPHLRDEVASLGLGLSVHFVGSIDQFEDVMRLYTFCRAFILASNQSEQWGLVVNEAMAAGVPVLVSRQCGCSRHLVQDGRNGYTFDGNSVDELTDRMLWMHMNEQHLAQMGRESAAMVAEYSPHNFAKNVDDLYCVAKSHVRGGPMTPTRFGS